MAYYGVSYRGGARIGQGFQRPQPSPDQGGRAPPRRPGRQGAGAGGRRGGGKLADILKDAAEQAAKQWAKDRFARYLWNQFSPWRRAKYTAKIAKYFLMDGPPPWDDLIPWREEQPQRFEVVGRPADAFYDCPSVTPPYPAVFKTSTGGDTIPEPWKCLGGQVPDTGDELADGEEVIYPHSPYTGAIIIGPGALWLEGRYRRMTFDLIWRWEWKKGQDGQWLPAGHIRHHAAKPPLFLPSPAPWFTPWPDDAPILQPTPMPRHVPYPKVPSLPDSPWPQGRKTAQPDNRTPPYLPPYADPEAGPGIETGGGGVGPAPPHVFLPPGPGQREKKGRLRGGPLAAKMIADALGGGLLEGADWIDAAWRALPKDKRCRASTPQAKLECLWKHLPDVDIAQFVANALVMEASDRLQGYVGRALAKASRRAGFQPGRGLQTGGAATRYAQQAAADLLKGL